MSAATIRTCVALQLLLAVPGLSQVSLSQHGPVVGGTETRTIGCPCSGGASENEPDCGLPVDTTNGGCNYDPNLFSVLRCGDTICGTAGASGGTRDTDWYALELTQTSNVELQVTAEFEEFTGILNSVGGPPSCGGFDTDWMNIASGCTPFADSRALSPGTWWVFVAPSVFDGLTCGASYTLTVQCPLYDNDFETYPPNFSAIQPPTCTGNCSNGYSVGGCYCDANCYEFGDCCLDACATCGECADVPPVSLTSCANHCGSTPNREGCYCDFLCLQIGDCCADACAQCGVCF